MTPPPVPQPFAQATPCRFAQGELLIDATDEPDEAWFIAEGLVRQYDILPNGSEFSLNIYKPGAVLALTWLFGEVPNHHYFQAIEPTAIRRVPKAAYRAYIDAHPQEALLILQRLSRGLDGMFSRLITNSQNDAAARVLNEVRIESSRFADSSHKLTVAMLARRTGLARETVSRTISQLVHEGTLEPTASGWRFAKDGVSE